jgi:hypothetical protein
MQILVIGGAILLGFVLGYFLQTGVLILLSVIIIMLAVLWLLKVQEIEIVLAIIFSYVGGISIVAMWVTWYFINDKTFIQDFFRYYVLR